MKKKIALLLVALLLVSVWPGAGLAATPFTNAVNQLNASGLESNTELNHTYIDLTNISTGTVTSKVYSGASQDITTDSYSGIQSQTYIQAHDRLTRFIFTLTNQYRPDTDLALSGTGSLPTVHTYTYGAMKDEAMWAITNGLADCLNNPPITSSSSNDKITTSSSTWIEKYAPEQIAETIATATFSIDSTTLMVSSSDSTTEPTTMEMDVAPEIINDRTYVPVRYLAYALGVPEEGVQWDGITETVTITKDDTVVGLTIGSATETVNGEPVEMDASPYVKEIKTGGRTMLPARWVAEPLGATVTWTEESQQMQIELPQSQTQQQQ